MTLMPPQSKNLLTSLVNMTAFIIKEVTDMLTASSRNTLWSCSLQLYSSWQFCHRVISNFQQS